MNVEEVNRSILEYLATQHQTYFVTGMFSERLDRANLAEVVLYAYGTFAGSDEAEEYREDREVREHEGFDDCETSPHFWRGVCEARRAELGMPFNRKPRKKTSAAGYHYPKFKVRGTQLLLSRLYDFFLRYSAYPQVANEHFEKQIDNKKGFVLLSGLPAQMAVYNLYHCAHIGGMIEKAQEIMEWRPQKGWGIGQEEWGAINPRVPDLSNLRPVDGTAFNAQP
jgi:hypothetical protein